MDTTAALIIRVPELAGVRRRAEDLVRDAGITRGPVLVDFTGTLSATQGFCDELVKQLAASPASFTSVVGVSERQRGHVALAIRLRKLEDRVGLR